MCYDKKIGLLNNIQYKGENMGEKKFTKSYRILQWGLFFGIIFAYLVYLSFSDKIELTGSLTPTILTHFVILILVLQIQTLFDMYSKFSPIFDMIFRSVITMYGAYVAIYLYLGDLHIIFPIVLGFIAFMNGVEVIRKLKELKK